MKRIKLTENELHLVIENSVKKILKEFGRTSGYVKPDGNSMTGGHWYHDSGILETAYINIADLFYDFFEDKVEDADTLYTESDLQEEYEVTATFEVGNDDSVGYSYTNFETYPKIDEQFYNDVQTLSIDDSLKNEFIKFVSDAVDRMDQDDFDFKNDY